MGLISMYSFGQVFVFANKALLINDNHVVFNQFNQMYAYHLCMLGLFGCKGMDQR